MKKLLILTILALGAGQAMATPRAQLVNGQYTCPYGYSVGMMPGMPGRSGSVICIANNLIPTYSPPPPAR